MNTPEWKIRTRKFLAYCPETKHYLAKSGGCIAPIMAGAFAAIGKKEDVQEMIDEYNNINNNSNSENFQFQIFEFCLESV